MERYHIVPSNYSDGQIERVVNKAFNTGTGLWECNNPPEDDTEVFTGNDDYDSGQRVTIVD